MAKRRIEDVISEKEKEALEAIQALRERVDRGEGKPGDSQILRAIEQEAAEEIRKCGGNEKKSVPSGVSEDRRGTQRVGA